MPRNPRKYSENGIYHVMSKGTNYQLIFVEEQDRRVFMKLLSNLKKEYDFLLYAWCLMDNHFHLLIHVTGSIEAISKVMQRLNCSYARYFNKKYKALGSLYYDRFRSEEVADARYLMAVIRYIHKNPVQTNLVSMPVDWKWSSCQSYYGRLTEHTSMTDHQPILKKFSPDKKKALEKFIRYNEASNTDSINLHPKKLKFSDQQAIEEIKNLIGTLPIYEIKHLNMNDRNNLISHLKRIEGISLRQLSRILGISLGVVQRAKFKRE